MNENINNLKIMKENIDLTKILKDCPKGTKLYSTIHGEVEFNSIHNRDIYKIEYKTKTSEVYGITPDGKFLSCFDGECILFPSKYQRDWSKFDAPWLKKQGEQKKQVHFPKFTFDDVLALQCCMETVEKVQEDKELYEQLNLIHNKIYDAYWLEKQDSPILSNSSNTGKNKPKFEPKTLKPFDKVLVKQNELCRWVCQFFSHIDNVNFHYKYRCICSSYDFCIPYNDDTKHLVGTNEEAPEYYRYWED